MVTTRARASVRIRARGGWALVDVIIGGMILAIGLATVVSIAERSLAMQQRAERETVAATLLDGLLSDVLATGVVEWETTRTPEGAFEAAVSTQEAALAAAAEEPMSDTERARLLAELRTHLAAFRSGRPWRESGGSG